MTKITELTNQLGEILLPRGYKKAGKLFYRVQGDGVVVFFCFEYDPGDRGHQLCFGIDSLYNSELKTPKELNLNPTFCLLTKQELQEYSFNNWCSITPPSNELLQSIVANDSSVFYKCLYKGAEEQNQKRNAREFDILRENDFLDRIDKLHDFTQVEAFMIEMAERDGIWHETDRQRFFYAYLSVGRYTDAVWAFRSIEKQNYWALYENSKYFESYDFESKRKECETYLTPRRRFVLLLEANKTEEVQKCLQEIYAHNLATFGVRKKRSKRVSKE
ncbi:MAG: hypothetical protein IJO14_02375 [Clostridia bacterium]|nr:hypothetical protein [Clostridia bacterium]